MRREFLEKVRTKWFVIATVLGPVLMIALIALPVLLATRGTRDRSIVILDGSTIGLGDRLAHKLADTAAGRRLRVRSVAADAGRVSVVADSLTSRVGVGGLDGFLLVTDSTLKNGKAEYRGTNVSSLTDMQRLQRRLDDAIVGERLSLVGVDPAIVQSAQTPKIDVTTRKIVNGKVTTESGEGSFALAYATWLILYMSIILYGVQVMGSVVEEKSTRIVEVLVSSLRPFELMAGKVLGVGAVGLFQLGIWGVSGALLFAQQARVASLLGAGAGSSSGFPSLSIATVAVVLAYFLLGYFLYASMLAAVAAMVNSESEARQAANPVIMLLVVPSVMMIGILNDPSGTPAYWLSTIPFTSPIAMPVRWAAAPVPLSQLAVSLGVLVVSVIAIVWVAARIYRVGILMYGKRPSLKELVRWVRTA
jgi:ABC-2 type transport system permease protein